MLPSLRAERQKPTRRSCRCIPGPGIVMQVPIEERNVEAGTIVWRDPDTGERFETPVTGGHAKLQWKPDWAMRWVALGVDYEMAGKDLIDSVKLSGEIARALGGLPPEGFNYELFLDEKGQKISKSKGNGLTIDEWLVLRDAGEPQPVHVQQAPRGEAAVLRRHSAAGRRLPDLPRQVSDAGREGASHESGLAHPCRRTAGAGTRCLPAAATSRARRSRSRCCSTSWRWRIRRTRRCCGASSAAMRRRLARNPSAPRCARARRRPLFPRFRQAAEDLPPAGRRWKRPRCRSSRTCWRRSRAASGRRRAEAIQEEIYNVGRAVPRYQDLKAKGATPERPGVSIEWFNTIYQVLLGEPRGPRFGSFVALYGVKETRALIAKALARRTRAASTRRFSRSGRPAAPPEAAAASAARPDRLTAAPT